MFCHQRFFFFSSIIILFILLSATGLQAQSSLKYSWYINANGGASQLYGDIQTENNPISKLSDETTFGFGARLGKYIGPVFTVHFQFLMSDFKGFNDNDDLKFSSNLMEYQLGTTINFTNLLFGKKERRLNFYGTTGIGLMLFRSEAYKISTGDLINDYGFTDDAERKKSSRETALTIPVGAGLDFKLADHWYMNLESVLSFTNSDKPDAKESGLQNDAYYYTSLGISFNFIGKKTEEVKIFEAPPEIVVDPFANENVDLKYDIPKNIKSTDEFILKSIVYKGKINGPGRLIQILPIGLDVLDTLIAGAKTECINYTLYLEWDELPADSVFEVSYRVKPNKIYGSFQMVSNLYLHRTGKEYKFKTSLNIELVEEDIAVEKPVVEVVQKDTLATKKDLEYRVQVTAGYQTKISVESLAAKFNLSDELKEDCVGNWCHYSVGSFDTYLQAKEYRNSLISDHGVRDAFIVAFYKSIRLNALSELKEIAAVQQPIRTVYKEDGLCYRVQIMAMLNKRVDPESLREMHKIEEEVNEEVYNNWHKYTVGKCTSIGESKLLLNKMKEKGLSDSFIVLYKNGERASGPQ
jgi:hypothetical protein